MTTVIPTVGNLPAALTSFVGRRREVAEIRRLLGVGRLLTLTGVGGVGKTRLALGAAEASRKAFPDGVWVVDLGAVEDPSAVTVTAAGALRVPDCGSGPVLGQLTGHLARRRALIVLDNCEHLIDACAELAKALLSACPEVRILATSRQTLRVTGEHVFTVPPLSVPDDALELLRDRTTALRPDFRITGANRAQAIRLCTDLDGLPLAIELAASRLRTLTVEQTVDRLADRFALLTGGCRTALPRQRTLRGMIEWSYELCTPVERLLWRRLSVFAGGFALEAAEQVCAGDGLAAHEVLDLLDRLVAQSVVLTCECEGMPRYRLLQTMREYGRARLTESGEEQHLLRRHRDFFLALAECTAARWFGPGQEEALIRLRMDHANLQLALEYGCAARPAAPEPVRAGSANPEQDKPENGAPDPADIQAALRLATALRFHWCANGFLGEGRRQFDRLLAAAPEPTPVRARALWAAAWVATHQGDAATADRWLDEAEELGERLDAPSVRPYVLGFRGASAAFQGRMAEALPLYERALAAHEEAGEGPGGLFWLLQMAITQGHLGDPRAEENSRHAVAVAEGQEERLYRSYAMRALGHVVWARGDGDEGMALARAALEILRGFNDHAGTGRVLELFAWITASRGDHGRAAQLLGAAHALSRDNGTCLDSMLGAQRVRCEEAIIAALGPDGYAKALADGGRHDSPAEAIALALDTTDAGQDAPVTTADAGQDAQVTTAPSPLSRRELEVATLVAKGMTNRQAASVLSLSPRTVDRHVENILAKLGFNCRAQIAAWWSQVPAA
ncbi:LuxR C-terminal-related transcriptional regulator [Streptomyces sp. MA5143a]|uniref:LuxR C-terminal-related transcriptional regulator n=1 Tax=Streptomyces sp. MA5143a TaxID=2083010 RepID=UPI000D1BC924|nr:LuxR C-terminal-related transcriptional regulator [Streptomyces sp. MA5143a]SPF07264.1 Regulatory protein AfsR [Streptomyces sp. MA5143a]